MTTLAPSPFTALPALPHIPSTTDLRTAARARLETLTRDVLPQLREQRAVVAAVWYSEDDDAELLHTPDGELLPCDPAGTDRLGTILANEDAFGREVIALRALTAALEDYESGGPALRAWLGDDSELPSIARAGHQRPRPSVAFSAGRGELRDPQRYVRQLREYLAVVRRDIARARAAGNLAQLQAHMREAEGIRERLVRERKALTESAPPRQRLHAARTELTDGTVARSA